MNPVQAELLKPFIEHLEFLGYTTEPLDTEQSSFGVKHPTRWNFILRPFPIGLLFTVTFGSTDDAKTNPTDILKLANALNRGFIICRAVVDQDNDINIEACFLYDYNKREFGVFLDSLENEVSNGFKRNEQDIARILK